MYVRYSPDLAKMSMKRVTLLELLSISLCLEELMLSMPHLLKIPIGINFVRIRNLSRQMVYSNWLRALASVVFV